MIFKTSPSVHIHVHHANKRTENKTLDNALTKETTFTTVYFDHYQRLEENIYGPIFLIY